MAGSLSAPPTTANRVLGLMGVFGGAILLAAFVPSFPWPSDAAFNLRLILFNAGAIAIVVGVHARQVSAAPRLALLAAVPAIMANLWYLVMVLIAITRSGPMFAGDFGVVFFAAGIVMWLTDASFGLVTLRLGVVSRWGALALAIGSLLAITGMDRFELTSPSIPTIFGPLALTGVALNGLGWIILGIDVATRGRWSEG